ncbi:Metallo-dependent phosphatase [Calocera cornea HHB12733]|uniref:Metallo-dependent phosphatase n=1 Tax=Calocera cornea HHB12733 TaxID=1353952 RepID=A0A165D6B2_9BASI|nr:Metallo-dependent phosphatase [Calocera cornea HHB12733]
MLFAAAAAAAAAALSLAALAGAQSSVALGNATFVAPGVFPTAAFDSYYNNATATDEQPQPVVTNILTGQPFPLALTDPNNIPVNDTADPRTFPPSPLPPSLASPLVQSAFAQIVSIANPNNTGWGNNSNCARCLAGLEVAKALALASSQSVPTLAVELCNYFKISTTCEQTYGVLALGQVLAQVLAAADVAGYDGQNICNNFVSGAPCALPPPSPLNMTGYFAKPKPANATAPAPSGERVKVLHISDFHLDARYANGAEANCTTSQCCRANNNNVHSPDQVLLPAPRFGTFTCDVPYSLGLAALQAIPAVTGAAFDFTIFTGDLVSHDPENELSQSLIEYTEASLYSLYKKYLGSGPLYAAIGNHDSYNQAEDAPLALGDQLGQANLSTQFSWNYDTLAALWEADDWISSDVAAQARAHYGAYSVARPDGLRIITLNTDLWYKANYFNYINMTKSDPSGMLRFVADELQAAEDAGERAWIIGHVLSGWDGSNPLNNPTNLFYQIVDRYSPHVVAAIFFGHTHEDQFQIFYANNATNASAASAAAVAWIAPSITPLTNLNSGFRMYEVDGKTFDILDAHTWYTNVSTFPALDNQTAVGPTFHYEYNTRQAYGTNISWPATAPLNATWWHRVTEQFEQHPALVQQFTTYQGKSSVLSPNCTSDLCVAAKICYMRSGSAPLGKLCTQGFGSVQ